VTVYIDDVNDNVPRFVQPLVTLTLSESASPRSTYVIPTVTFPCVVSSTYVIAAAVDADSPQFAVQRYELDSFTDKFGLQVTQNIDGTQEVPGLFIVGSCIFMSCGGAVVAGTVAATIAAQTHKLYSEFTTNRTSGV